MPADKGDGPVLMAWSGGKDSAMALHALRAARPVSALLTVVTEQYDRISMHGVRRELLEAQARAIGLPLEIVLLPPGASNEIYEQRMKDALCRRRGLDGVRTVAFGDLFLEEVRQYRIDNLARVDMRAQFPLWGKNTGDLARGFIASGFRAILTCVDTHALDGAFVGREFDSSLLADLPRTADPCGENGEFHTFVYAGPIFKCPIPVARGEKVLRDGRFMYCDLLPA
jgi:uncharacterized protein (TIGR00290 family)